MHRTESRLKICMLVPKDLRGAESFPIRMIGNETENNGRLFLSVTIRASLRSKRSSENLSCPFFDMDRIGYLSELSLETFTTND